MVAAKRYMLGSESGLSESSEPPYGSPALKSGENSAAAVTRREGARSSGTRQLLPSSPAGPGRGGAGGRAG